MSDTKLNKKTVLSGMIWKLSERIMAQAISLLVSVLLARLLVPEDYGIVAMVMVFISIANVFVSNGFGNALVQKKNADNLDFSSVFWLNLLLGTIIYCILFIAAPTISSFYNMPKLTSVIRVIGLRIIIASINSIQQAYVSKNMLFKKFFWATLIGTVISGIVGILMAYSGYGVWSLVAQYLVNTCIDTMVLWLTVKWRPIFKISLSRSKKLFSFGYKILLSGLIDTVYAQLRSLVIGKKYSSSDLAYYNQGDRYPNFIAVNINSSLQAVLFPVMAEHQNDKQKLRNITRLSIRACSFIIWPTMIGLAVVCDSLVSILLTDKWKMCIPFIRIFCISYSFWPIHTSNLQAINALGKSNIILRLEIIKKVVGVIALVLTIKSGPLTIAYGMLISDIICLIINAFPNISLLGYSLKQQLWDILPCMISSLGMALIVFPLNLLFYSDMLTLFCQILLGIISYLLLSYITNREIMIYVFGLFKSLKKGHV